MRVNEKIKTIFELVLEQIADIYLYFLGGYVVSLILSYFFESWRLFFNWPVFHLSIIFFGILSLLSKRGREFILSQKKFIVSKIVLPKGGLLSILKSKAKSLASAFVLKIKGLTKKHYLKIELIILVSIYFLSKEINPINFLILVYALFSILFVMESRIAAGIALLFLTSCPILLILKKEAMAETMAIYAYYFLVITVLTQIREYLLEGEKEPEKVIHS